MANVAKKNSYVDPGWPQGLESGAHPVTELLARHAGGDSPFGDVEFPVDPATLPYVHPHTVINK